jgi:subtilase-type serine protease
VHFHLSSVSCLALATVATLALPMSASAEDYAIRNGQRVAASLEMPVNTPNRAAGAVVNDGSLYSADVAENDTFLNKSGGAVKHFTNSGASVNDGSMYGVEQKAGSFINGATGSVYGLSQNGGTSVNNGKIVNAGIDAGNFTNNASGTIVGATVRNGSLTNAGQITNVDVDTGGNFTNNSTGLIKSLSNSGIVSNDGGITTVKMAAGVLTNSANGTIDSLDMLAGTVTNAGTIKITTIQAGRLTNNATGVIGEATVQSGALANGGRIDSVKIETLATLTNNQTGIVGTLINAGTVTNSGQIGTVTQTAGELTNNGTILGVTTINGGMLTNNRTLDATTISAGTTFVNNQTGIARSVTNSGLVSNGGTIQFVDQVSGVLINGENGTISGLNQTGGATTNNGQIDRLIVNGGTLDNNEEATIAQGNIETGTLVNSGAITNLSVGDNGTFNNNASGSVDNVSSLGEGSNAGRIGNLEIDAGRFGNTGLVAGDVAVNGATFTSTGMIIGTLSNNGTAAQQGVAYLSGAVNGGIINSLNGAINIRGDLEGHGDFINNGIVGTAGNTISGFDRFMNNGTLSVRGDAEIATDVVSSGKILMGGNATEFETLSVGGDLTLTSRSETSINIAVNGDHDTLSTGGDLTLGGRLNVTATGEDYAMKSTYETFTSTAGKMVGRFTDVVVSGATNLFGAIEESATGLVLAIRNRDLLNEQLGELDLGPNGQILTELNYSGEQGAELFDTLATVEAQDAPGLMAQITGAATSAVTNVGSSAADGFGKLMQKVATASGLRRNNDAVLAYEKAMAKEQDGKFEPVLGQGQGAVGFWARGFGETGESNGGGEAMVAGVGAGADVALGESLTVGASAGYSMASFGQGSSVEGKTNSFHAGGYISMGATAPEATGFGLTASGTYSKHDNNANRTIKIGSLTSVANANYGGTTIAGEVMVRNGFTIGDKVPLTIAPVAGVKFALDKDDAYTETGAGALNLNVGSTSRKSLVGVVGLQLASRIETTSVVFIPHVSGLYQHEFFDTSSTTTRTLAGSSTAFTVKQAGSARESLALEAGLGLRFASGLAVDVSGYGVLSADEKRYGATATVKAGF